MSTRRFVVAFAAGLGLLAVFLVSLAFAGTGPGAIPQPGDLVITEFMADPAAVADTAGEWLELHNTSAVDLDLNGCVLHATGANTHTISSPLAVTTGGYVVLGKSTNPASNGGAAVDYAYGASFSLSNTADQIILDCNGLEIDRVEYDAGTGWPSIPSGAALGYSGSGDNNDGANWCAQTSTYGLGDRGTPGAANDPCLPPNYPLPGELVIDEFMANPDAVEDTVGEWVELRNVSANNRDLNGCVLHATGANTHTIGLSLPAPAGDFVVLGKSTDPGTNGGAAVDYAYGASFSLSNTADQIILDCNGLEIDRVEYDTGAGWPSIPSGASLGYKGAGNNNDGANWCAQTSTYGQGDRGTPGAANDPCAPPNVPLPGEVIINEFMANPDAVDDSVGEWIELRSIAVSARDLNGCLLRATGANTHTISLSVPVPAGGYVVLGKSTDQGVNGGAPVDYAYGASFGLTSTADQIYLDCNDVTVDRVEYDTGAGWPSITAGVALGYKGSGDNNSPASWCAQSTPYGLGDRGTPGAANDACQLQCDVNGDSQVNIVDVQSVAGAFGADPAPPAYDLSPNGVIDVFDVTLAAICWLNAAGG